jgi:hypothetical protein
MSGAGLGGGRATLADQFAMHVAEIGVGAPVREAP